jgi:hypothetical protein
LAVLCFSYLLCHGFNDEWDIKVEENRDSGDQQNYLKKIVNSNYFGYSLYHVYLGFRLCLGKRRKIAIFGYNWNELE